MAGRTWQRDRSFERSSPPVSGRSTPTPRGYATAPRDFLHKYHTVSDNVSWTPCNHLTACLPATWAFGPAETKNPQQGLLNLSFWFWFCCLLLVFHSFHYELNNRAAKNWTLKSKACYSVSMFKLCITIGMEKVLAVILLLKDKVMTFHFGYASNIAVHRRVHICPQSL